MTAWVIFDRLVATIEPSYRPGYSAETVTDSLVIDEPELANSRWNGLGRLCGHCGFGIPF
jgi:hypothetical protein